MPNPSFTVTAADAVAPYVLAIDVGSTGTRSGLYDGAGRPVRGSAIVVGGTGVGSHRVLTSSRRVVAQRAGRVGLGRSLIGRLVGARR